LSQIAHILDLNDKGIKSCAQVREILENKQVELKHQIRSLTLLHKELSQWIQKLPPGGIQGKICGCIETHNILVHK
jgi:DNA-binding transcriptional MerR regulator